MNNYEPFHQSYTRIQYRNYKSEKLTSYQEVEVEKAKALSFADEIKVVSFVRQSNGLYAGNVKKYYNKNDSWRQETA